MEMMDKNFVPEESGHFTVDEKSRQVELTEAGHEFVEDLLIKQKLLAEGESLYAATNLSAAPCSCGFKAHHLFNRDIEYIVQNKKIVLIDEHTGRTMEGAGFQKGCIRPLRPRKISKFRARARLWPLQHFRITFGSTANCLA